MLLVLCCVLLQRAQELQEERMAAIGDPAHKRDTLGDKVSGVCIVRAKNQPASGPW